ncbi:MAG: 4Fe-4S dicluster domain-containing protein [Candidatus Zixiibacteriota bacterium]|nr:MAG: 4Fe-4S dicluster domain-containing protein [candidate division Zixibacteria bacterium]
MARYAMAIDLNKCVGCGACALACKTENNTQPEQDDGNVSNKYNWADFVTTDEGTFAEGNVKYKVMPVLCNHCTDAPCIQWCPARPTALYKTEDGITVHNSERCIGCQFCQVRCPYSYRDVKPEGVQYSVISFNDFDKDTQSFYQDDTPIIPGCTSTPAETAALAGTTPPDKNEYTDPDYEAVRRPGIVEKCSFCRHRVVNGDDPYCVVSCPTGARVFGDIEDPDSDISKVLAANGYERLADNSGKMLAAGEKGTDPHVFYIGRFEGGDGQ